MNLSNVALPVRHCNLFLLSQNYFMPKEYFYTDYRICFQISIPGPPAARKLMTKKRGGLGVCQTVEAPSRSIRYIKRALLKHLYLYVVEEPAVEYLG